MNIKNTAYALLILLFTNVASAVSYYVDNVNGNNRNSGTKKNEAFKSISYSLKKMVPGDTLFVISNGPMKPYREKLFVTFAGSEKKITKIKGDSGAGKAYIVGLTDVSGRWALASFKPWMLDNPPKLRGLWSATSSQWAVEGIKALKPLTLAKSKSVLAPGQWFIDEEKNQLFLT